MRDYPKTTTTRIIGNKDFGTGDLDIPTKMADEQVVEEYDKIKKDRAEFCHGCKFGKMSNKPISKTPIPNPEIPLD